MHLAAQVASCRWGLHINASRNARIRQVEWQELQLALEVGCGIKCPKILASAETASPHKIARCSLAVAALQGPHEHTA